ncbi:MAG: site-specific DNA-methyltransferase [Chloroflexi bacterium]|nr:site-specific DNA-methyltransferase [Chloroflexota bacterium]
MQIISESSHSIHLYHDDALNCYDIWGSPIVIVSDGAYGISGFPGDPPTYESLDMWYDPHVRKWSERSTPQTTLWFWNTEIGWAIVHPVLARYGWEYRACHIWDKGIAHVAGNSNTQSLRKLPIVTEVCVQYVKRPVFHANGQQLSMRDWLRYEWERTGLPFSKTNEAAGVKDAATRKYFTKDHLWYFPPGEAFERIAAYANQFGQKQGRPYFSTDGHQPVSREQWEKLRSKFYCPIGITNVWREPPVNGEERIKRGTKAFHLNQKPIKLMERIITISSDPGDLVWEPFGGLCTAAIASHNLKRSCVATESNANIFSAAVTRLRQHVAVMRLDL